MTGKLESDIPIGALIGSALDHASYSSLWRHVLAAMLTDACSKKPSVKKDVYDWTTSSDIEITCYFAGVSEGWAREAIHSVLRQHNRIIAKHLMLKTRRLLLAGQKQL